MSEVWLGAEDLERLVAAQRVLLSPLNHADAIEWQLRANAAVRQLVRADHSVFSLPTESGPALVTDDTDPTFPERFLSYFIGVESGENRFRDPLIEDLGRVRRAAGPGAFHELMLSSRNALRQSSAYQELFVGAGLTNLIGFSTPLPVGEATQFFSFQGAGAAKRSQRGLAILRLLVPAFEAGIRVQRQMMVQGAALASLLDRAGCTAALYSPDGALLHPSNALLDLLAADPEAEALWQHAGELARALAGRWSSSRKTVEAPMPGDTTAYFATRAAGYRLVGSYLEAERFGTEGVLVLIEQLRPLLPPAAELCARFRLTAREAQVALLLAEGATDGTIADELDVSPHTARRYSERVLGKLGLHSRAAVAVTLLRGSRTTSLVS